MVNYFRDNDTQQTSNFDDEKKIRVREEMLRTIKNKETLIFPKGNHYYEFMVDSIYHCNNPQYITAQNHHACVSVSATVSYAFA